MPIPKVSDAAPIFPAVVVGTALGRAFRDINAPNVFDDFQDELAAVVQLDHQFGGYACLQETFIGVVLRLAGNAACACRPLDDLLRAFDLLPRASYQPAVIHREFPGLATLSPTSGEDLGTPELAALNDFLGQFFDFPKILSGREALVELEMPPARSPFDNWRVWRRKPGHAGSPEAVGSFMCDEEITFAAPEKSLRGVVAKVTKSLGLSDTRVRAFFVWENSD